MTDTLNPGGYLAHSCFLSTKGAGTSRDLAESSVQTYCCCFRINHTQMPLLLMGVKDRISVHKYSYIQEEL